VAKRAEVWCLNVGWIDWVVIETEGLLESCYTQTISRDEIKCNLPEIRLRKVNHINSIICENDG